MKYNNEIIIDGPPYYLADFIFVAKKFIKRLSKEKYQDIQDMSFRMVLTLEEFVYRLDLRYINPSFHV